MLLPVSLAPFLISHLSTWSHDPQNLADLRECSIVCLEGHLRRFFGCAPPAQPETSASKASRPDPKVASKVMILGLDVAAPSIRSLKLPLNEEIRATFLFRRLLKQDLEVVPFLRCRRVRGVWKRRMMHVGLVLTWSGGCAVWGTSLPTAGLGGCVSSATIS